MSNFDKQKLVRKRKISQVNNPDHLEPVEKDSLEAKKRSTRKSVDKVLNENCFFCGGCSKDMHRCLTLRLHHQIKDIATEMCDNEVLGKLIKGDMVATDAKYHLKCLVEYKNKYRSFKSPGKVIKESSLIEGIIGSKGAYYISQAGNVAGRPFR